MKNRSNEQLCALAQNGDTNARDLLLKNNFGFIRKIAYEVFLSMNLPKATLELRRTIWNRKAALAYWRPSFALTVAKARSF